MSSVHQPVCICTSGVTFRHFLPWSCVPMSHPCTSTPSPGATRSASTACPHTPTLASPPATSQTPRLTLRALDLLPTSGIQNQTRSPKWNTLMCLGFIFQPAIYTKVFWIDLSHGPFCNLLYGMTHSGYCYFVSLYRDCFLTN